MLLLPPGEVRLLNRTISAAISLVEKGQVARGYDMLLVGLGRARIKRSRGEKWGEELATLWAQACDVYCASYGVPIG